MVGTVAGLRSGTRSDSPGSLAVVGFGPIEVYRGHMPVGTTWNPHLRLSFGGTLGVPAIEEWSNTVRFKMAQFEPTEATLQDACNRVVTPIRQWLADPGSHISQAAALTWVKLNYIETTGLQRAGNTILTDVVAPNTGSVAGPPPPFYQTYAITLRTRTRRGRAHAGRIFPPLVTHIPQDDGSPYLSDGAAASMATAFSSMLQQCRARIGQAFVVQDPTTVSPDPAVFSPGVADKGTVPLNDVFITAVVDRVPDVQHRRTKQLPRLEGTGANINAA